MSAPSKGTDIQAFVEEIDALGAEARRSTGQEDFLHLLRIERIGRACSAAGFLTAWIAPNPVSAGLLALGLTVRLVIGHHIGHGAYDRIQGIPARYTRRDFARGRRRVIDWLEWWTPGSWHFVHDVLHHRHTGDPLDPDVMDEGIVRERLPLAVRYGVLALFALTWKFSFYAPHLHREWAQHRRGDARSGPYRLRLAHLFDFRDPDVRSLWWRCYLPYVALRFGLTPLLFLPLGLGAWLSALCNFVLAELLTNLQGFICIRASHSAEDIPIFAEKVGNKADFYVRQILGTVNYTPGKDLVDILHVWTNYQIEHHLWPDLTLLKYRQLQPKAREACERHGLPYLQESVFARFRRTARIFVGSAVQRVVHTTALDRVGR